MFQKWCRNVAPNRMENQEYQEQLKLVDVIQDYCLHLVGVRSYTLAAYANQPPMSFCQLVHPDPKKKQEAAQAAVKEWQVLLQAERNCIMIYVRYDVPSLVAVIINWQAMYGTMHCYINAATFHCTHLWKSHLVAPETTTYKHYYQSIEQMLHVTNQT